MRKSVLILAMIALVALFASSCNSDPVHEHSLIIRNDETGHWSECSECGEKSEVSKHVYGDAVINVENAELIKTCSKCGYKDSQAILVANDEASLKAAIVDGSKTIYLAADIDLTGSIEVKNKVALNLNNKKISNGNGSAIIIDSGEITIDGNGVVSARSFAIWAINDGKVTIESGKYIGDSAIGAGMFDGKNFSNGSVTINGGEIEAQEFSVGVWGKSSATINGGTFTSKDNAVIGTNGSSPLTSAPYDITINGGVFNGKISSSGYIACGIYMANSGNVELNGGTFNIEGGVGILVRSGNLTANNVEIKLTKKAGLESGKVGDSKVVITGGSQIVVDDKAGYPGAGPKVVENKTSYEVKTTEGTAYSAK